MSPRYAIYAAPGSGIADPAARTLLERAEAWLGRSTSGAPVPAAAPERWTRADVDALTVDARRYGFHGTLKAPFRLAEHRTPDELEKAVAAHAITMPAVPIPRLRLSRIDRFLALTPGGPADALNAVAADVVTTFEEFRAPATAAETARRRPESLTPRQRELLTAYGYPYVLDQFRFHLTLTDRVATARLDEVEDTLTTWFAGVLDQDLTLDALAVFVEPAPGAPFSVHSLHPLRRPRPLRRSDHQGAR